MLRVEFRLLRKATGKHTVELFLIVSLLPNVHERLISFLAIDFLPVRDLRELTPTNCKRMRLI